MSVHIVGPYVVIVHDKATPNDRDWRAWLADYERRMSGMKGLLVYSLGGGPDAAQRSELTLLLESQAVHHPTAVVAPSPLVRGLITAMNWFLRAELRGAVFAPRDLELALDHLKVEEPNRQLIRQHVDTQAKTLVLPSAAP